MKIFVIIPVHNRLAHTQKIVEVLRNQEIFDQLKIIIIDDGSSDGTAEYLSLQNDLKTLRGNGNLWWAGAVELGLRYILNEASDVDFVLLLNDDTSFEADYLKLLVETAQANPSAIIGSALHEIGTNPSLVSLGALLNLNRIQVWDKLSTLNMAEREMPKALYEVDALSGRGTLYPVYALKKYGGLIPKLLPHYLADYELSMRHKKNGMKLIVSTSAKIWSYPVYGNNSSRFSGISQYFSKGSPKNIIFITIFYLRVGTIFQRITAPIRVCFFYSYRNIFLRRKL